MSRRYVDVHLRVGALQEDDEEGAAAAIEVVALAVGGADHRRVPAEKLAPRFIGVFGDKLILLGSPVK